MMSLLSRVRVPLVVAALGVLACGDSSGPDSGQLSILLKDAPGDVQAAVVTISEINLQGSGGTTVLSSTSVTTDLLTLSADAASLLQDAEVPAGSYSQLRFVITGAYIQVDNGDGTSSIFASSPDYQGLPAGAVVTGNLQMPSLAQSGLKITLPGDRLIIAGGDQKILVVDFDVSQSFGHAAGNSGQWVMHPVIKADDVSASGGATVTLVLAGGVTLPGAATLGEFSATLTGSDGVARTAIFTDTDGDGTFESAFKFLEAGDYEVGLIAPLGVTSFTTTPAFPLTLTVSAGATATAAFTLTAAT